MNELMKPLTALLASIPVLILWYAVFAALERLSPAVAHKPLRRWVFNIATAVFYMLIGGVAAVIGGMVKAALHGGLIDLRIRNTTGILGGVAATLLFFLIFDFFYYWWHRTQHKLPALWAIHKLHHLDEGVNVSTNLRHHWLEELGRIPFIVIPMAILFDLSPQAGGAIGFVVSAWGFFFHSNLRLNLGPFSWILSAPQVHRIHHSRLTEHFDRNFAAFFPIWDVIFGSYFHPRRGEFPPTGIAGEPDVTTVLDGALLPFRTWRQALRARSARASLLR